MNMTIDKKKYSTPLPQNWPVRDEQTTLKKTSSQTSASSSSTGKVDPYYFSRNNSILPPIRQTASIFKQPVTVYKLQKEGKVKDVKTGNPDKPKQLFWEKRLEGLKACDKNGFEFSCIDLPKILKPVGPYVTEQTVLQSVATALHLSSQSVTGQTGSKSSLEKNPGVFLNPEQPLIQAVQITDEDIKKQEDRVILARKKLQEVVQTMYA